jgi:diguanylate cyclase (GGDEF)-like protein
MSTVQADLQGLLLPLLAFASIGIAYGVLYRTLGAGIGRDVATGLLFGGAAVLMMEFPVELAPGVNVDMRHLAIAFAGAFAGAPAMAIALAMGVTARLLAGGDGALAGAGGMAIAGGAGLLWAGVQRSDERLSIRSLLLLGAMICAHLAAALVLPLDMAVEFLLRFGPEMAGLNMAGALVIGGAIGRERLLVLTEETLSDVADRDPLTGALNRRGFDRLVQGQRARKAPGAHDLILVLDLDRFKRVNDVHGHVAGDEILVQACRRIQGGLRAGDLLGRFGGEEFVVFLGSVGREQAFGVARRLQAAIGAHPFYAAGRSIAVTASAGACWFEGEDMGAAFEHADALLYEAKNAGRNRLVLEPSIPAQDEPVTRAA